MIPRAFRSLILGYLWFITMLSNELRQDFCQVSRVDLRSGFPIRAR
jgi:hypothetical protein